MSAWPERRGPAAPLQALVARAAALVLEPADGAGGAALASALDEPDPPRPVVAVVGLAHRAGTSTVARAVAARLASADRERAAILVTGDPPRAGLATPAAARLARALEEMTDLRGRALGRLCVVDAEEPLAAIAGARAAPLVADVQHGASPDAAVALADHVVLVAPPDVEPSLAGAVETALRTGGRGVSLVLSRVVEQPEAGLERALVVPEARLAARLTLSGREVRGPLGEAAWELSERALAEVWR